MTYELTPLQIEVLQRLRHQDCHFIAEATERHWKQGESYYIDSRVPVKNIRRKFNQCNKELEKKKQTTNASQ